MESTDTFVFNGMPAVVPMSVLVVPVEIESSSKIGQKLEDAMDVTMDTLSRGVHRGSEALSYGGEVISEKTHGLVDSLAHGAGSATVVVSRATHDAKEGMISAADNVKQGVLLATDNVKQGVTHATDVVVHKATDLRDITRANADKMADTVVHKTQELRDQALHQKEVAQHSITSTMDEGKLIVSKNMDIAVATLREGAAETRDFIAQAAGTATVVVKRRASDAGLKIQQSASGAKEVVIEVAEVVRDAALKAKDQVMDMAKTAGGKISEVALEIKEKVMEKMHMAGEKLSIGQQDTTMHLVAPEPILGAQLTMDTLVEEQMPLSKKAKLSNTSSWESEGGATIYGASTQSAKSKVIVHESPLFKMEGQHEGFTLTNNTTSAM